MADDLVIRPLTERDSLALATMLREQPPDYLRFFSPFPFDQSTIAGMLGAKRRDVYMGIFVGEQLAAFFMLRGWDEGYDVPTYGVAVDQSFTRQGLGRLTLDLTKVICRQRDTRRIMLKVHSDNLIARHLYEREGFVHTGKDAASQHLVFHFELAPPNSIP